MSNNWEDEANFLDEQIDLTTTIMEAIQRRYRDLFQERFQLNQPLSRYTSSRVGGAADMFVTANNRSELQTAVELAYAQHLPYFVLGGGSNILVADQGIRGLVIMNKAREIHFRHNGFSVVCTAESGMNLSSLARLCISKGLGGLEWAVSVPGTVGGAVVGNAGAHGSEIGDLVLEVSVWDPVFGVVVLSREEMAYGYRDSILKREQDQKAARRVVLSVELELKSEPTEVLSARAAAFVARRKETQPGGASVGSMFKNPENYYAGYLLEAAGLKGFRCGGAQISEKHANFFICEEVATAEDVRCLIAEAWNAVREKFGIELELEVELVGEWRFEDDPQ